MRKVVNKYYDYKLSFDFKINTFLLKDVWKTGLGLFLSQGTIFITILYVIENFKLEVSTLFMIYIQYHKAISAFSQVPLYSKIPIYSKMYASKKIEELNTYFTKNMIKSLSLIFFIVILLFITRFTKFGETIFNTNHGLDLQLLISMYYIIQRLNSSLLQFYSVTNEVIWHKMNSVNLVGLSIVIFTHFYYGVLDIELLVLVGICVELFLFFPIIKIYLRSFCLNIKWHFDYLFILFSTFCVGLLYVVF